VAFGRAVPLETLQDARIMHADISVSNAIQSYQLGQRLDKIIRQPR
jgi:hypothetical protein